MRDSCASGDVVDEDGDVIAVVVTGSSTLVLRVICITYGSLKSI